MNQIIENARGIGYTIVKYKMCDESILYGILGMEDFFTQGRGKIISRKVLPPIENKQNSKLVKRKIHHSNGHIETIMIPKI